MNAVLSNPKHPEYGRYMIQESGHSKYDPNLEDFYDYKRYAQCRIAEYPGKFTSRGYVSYTGAMPLEELIQDQPLVGQLTFGNGDTQSYTNAEEFPNAVKQEWWIVMTSTA